jgi:chlorite dismutase
MSSRAFTFTGGTTGSYRVTRVAAVTGETLPHAARVSVTSGIAPVAGAAWSLRGVTSNQRYVTRAEATKLAVHPPVYDRPEATHAALIPIRKNAAWWAMTQDERRAVLEERSHHIEIGLRYVPAVSRRLHHCRDLGTDEPFDFLTWFEFSPADEPAFDELLAALRATPEWTYVEREVDVRLVRD